MKIRIWEESTDNWQPDPKITKWSRNLSYEGEDLEDAKQHYIGCKSNESGSEEGHPSKRVAVEIEDKNGKWISRLGQDAIDLLFDSETNAE